MNFSAGDYNAETGRLKTIKLVFILLSISGFSLPCGACKPVMYGRYDDGDGLVQKTEEIVVASVKSISVSKIHGFQKSNKFDYTFSIRKVLKGKPKSKEFSITAMDSPDSVEPVSFGLDCKNHGGFKKEKTYLIFLNSVNEKGYKEIIGDNDRWLVEVQHKIKEQDKKHKKLLK